MMQTLSRSGKPPIPIGISLGKSKVVDPENLQAVIEDHLYSLLLLHQFGDYFVLNVSSPNTIGLRRLQARQALEALLTQLDQKRKTERHRLRRDIPLLVKLAPDLTNQELDDALDAILCTGMDGVIATNTKYRLRCLRRIRSAPNRPIICPSG